MLTQEHAISLMDRDTDDARVTSLPALADGLYIVTPHPGVAAASMYGPFKTLADYDTYREDHNCEPPTSDESVMLMAQGAEVASFKPEGDPDTILWPSISQTEVLDALKVTLMSPMAAGLAMATLLGHKMEDPHSPHAFGSTRRAFCEACQNAVLVASYFPYGSAVEEVCSGG